MSSDTCLDDRKVTILKAIIKTYLETGEPVGSRTISKYSELKLSSATIRNEMSDLEEMGYILQPHTSAGRIPSDKGYRFYVDQIMQEKDNEVTEFKELRDEQVLNLNILLNSSLNGLTIEEINLDIISRLKSDAGIHSQVVELVLNEVATAIRAGEEDLQIYTSGATNIFKYPELSEGDKASQLISTLEHKELLQEFVSEVNAGAEEESGIQVYIGDESPVQSMKDCSVVTANYDLGGGLRGTIGIIGPKRMDYEKVLGTLRNLMSQLDTAFKKDER